MDASPEFLKLSGGEMLDLIFEALFDWVLLLPFFLKKRWEIRQEWSGTVGKKKVLAAFNLSRYRYSVTFETEEGKKKKLRMRKEDFDLYQEGRRYTKRAGAYLPDPHSAI
jgi:hypothetical protein